ncbi:MAG: alpha/beta hydrolase [Gammaproteobacteria bacterium]|nr:alpha/beta hydrolase [Gammaproteobacteria bacterium]
MHDPELHEDLRDLDSGPYPQWFTEALAVPRRERSTIVDGCDIHFFEWGAPDEGKPRRPGVVMTHGMMAHARCWAFIAPRLAQHYHVVAFDLSGMGDSGHRCGGYTLEQRAAEAVGVAEACGMYTDDARPALVCHSYGGTVGLASAELYPDRFAALIACDMSMSRPGNRSESFQERVRNRPAPRPHRIHPTREAILARFRLAPDQPCANTYLFDYLANHSIREADGGYCWKFDPGIFAMDGQRDTTWWDSIAGRFAGLSLPRGLIYGMNSELVNADATDYVCALTEDFIPVRGIADAWHHLMLDQPLHLTQAIRDTFSDLSVGTPITG